MTAITCPPWCDGKHEATTLLETLSAGSVVHRTDLHLAGEDDDLGALAWIDSQVRWHTDPVTGDRVVNASDPGICIDPYFSEVYLNPPEIAELLEIVGKAQRRLAQIHSHNR